MIAESIELNRFRNYEAEKIEFDKKINIIYGNNAQGKTNILEAVYIFSLGKSNRAYHDSDVIKFGCTDSNIKMNFISRDTECSGEINLFKNKRKQIFINEIPVKKSSELVGRFNVVYFGPEYLSLIKDGPKKRRKNTDILISQLKTGYLSAISEYKRVIEQKNNLLKQDRIDEIFLSVLNEKVIDLSEYIIKCRYEYIKKTERISKKIQLDISGGKENLDIGYISCGIKIDDENIEGIKDILKEKSVKVFEKERYTRESILGVHRDDIEFKINGADLKIFGSQGQQKTCILVQKIAEVELFKEERGEYPVLLLDDIMSELDNIRQDYVLNKIENMQIFITCTDKERFKNLEKGKFIEIERGRVKNCTFI